MPGVDGIEAAEVIGAERIAPVVMVTAFSQASYVEQAASAGAMAYVVKPFTRTDVLPAMALATARFAEASALVAEVEDLGERLETRKVVDRAKGILMARGMSEPEAFKRLQKLAMDKRKTLREIAEAVIMPPRPRGSRRSQRTDSKLVAMFDAAPRIAVMLLISRQCNRYALENVHMDAIDLAIMNALVLDGRMTFSELADRIVHVGSVDVRAGPATRELREPSPATRRRWTLRPSARIWPRSSR